MWNAIQARHPMEASQLSDSPAVITYHPTSPVKSALRPQASLHATNADSHLLVLLNQNITEGPDSVQTEIQVSPEPPHVASTANTQPTDVGAAVAILQRSSVFDTLTAMPSRILAAYGHASHPSPPRHVSSSAMPSLADTSDSARAVLSRSSSAMQQFAAMGMASIASLGTGSTDRLQVLRQAQAAFADVRQLDASLSHPQIR